ncbi:MAG: IPT/TIG domain-containing protein [Treponema sp.]|nr:IPT/TIG domain-containing protein [Treponema sp.]
MRRLIFTILSCIIFLLACSEQNPIIHSINPRIGRMGDILVIHGSGFGEDRNQSYVSIAGTAPVSGSYISWSDGEIIVRLPEFGDAGLIYVHRGNNRSNPALFTNQGSLPAQLDNNENNGPRITSIEPASGPIGTLLTIRGSNFGISRNNSGVFFAWQSESGLEAFVEVSETEFGYDFWSEREIRVRVPSGAISGNLELRTPRGNSRPISFDITGMPGTKSYRDSRTYTFSYNVDIDILSASSPNDLFIWMPQPAPSSSQRNIRLLSRSPDPFIENHRGTSIFHLVNTVTGNTEAFNLSFAMDTYTVETNIRAQAPIRLNTPSPIGEIYVLPSALIPSDDPDIIALSRQIIGNERFPLEQARRIYNWLLASAGVQIQPFPGDILQALEENHSDNYSATLLFCALARAAGIPVIPVEGVLVNRLRETSRHFWAEFWLDGFGWVPVDPALGAGAAPPNFTLREDHAQYYFGNLDNMRVAFSRGERFLAQMSPQGRSVISGRDFSLQSLWEEAVGGIQSYSSVWSDVIITGMNVQ